MSYLKDFLASIKEVKFFSGAGKLRLGCVLFDTRADAEEAAEAAAEEAEWEAEWDSAWDATWNATWDSAEEAAEEAALDAEWKAAWKAAGEVAGEAAGAAAWDAALVAACMSVWNNPSEPNTVYALKRWSVWQAGFGLLCDIRGTLYCYRRVV